MNKCAVSLYASFYFLEDSVNFFKTNKLRLRIFKFFIYFMGIFYSDAFFFKFILNKFILTASSTAFLLKNSMLIRQSGLKEVFIKVDIKCISYNYL